MKFKKFTVICLLTIFFLSQFSWISIGNLVNAEEKQQVSGGFHYEQLETEAQKIYQGMYNMYTQGILKTGTESYDLIENGIFTEEEIKKYDKDNSELMSSMNAARYAFYADYPGIFYVDFQKVTIRTTKDAENKYHAYLGSGRQANYYVDGFTSKEQVERAIIEFDNCVNEIAEKAKNVEVEENGNKMVEQIKLVHNEIIYNTGYRLESDCVPGDEGFINTPYGALVKKEAVCEGYARAFKAILDKLGINNILVQGLHQSEGSAAIPHMWNYVEIEKETLARSTEKVWYAVDCTMDDPILRDTTFDTTAPEFVPGSDIKEGFENTRFCLVGTETMNNEHTVLESVEAAGYYIFKYPELHVEDYGIDTITNNNGLLIKFKQEGTETETYQAGDFYISYNEKGYEKASEDGYYILMKYHQYRPGDDVWNEGNWGYFLPDVYMGGFEDYEDHVYVSVPNSEYVEFAVTTLAPGDYKNDIKYLTYQGDESDFVAQSGKLYNPNGTYKAPPYVKTQTPEPTTTLAVGPTYHVDVTYDDALVLAEGATEAGYRLESNGPTGADEAKITNFKFDGDSRITFDLQFSRMWADDGAMYYIYITGLVGKNSGKEPLQITYGAVNPILCPFRMNAARNWEVFATPRLLESQDLSMNGWVTSDGTQVSDKLNSRIALVTTRTTKAESDAMNELMENQLGDQELITSETYNISLNVCREYVVRTGHRLRLSLGFPAGYGPEDEGVTFKAYHFITDSAGNVTGVEEIPCVVTKYGLIVTCDAFSPFAIAVVEDDGTVPQNKSLVVSTTGGGIIEGANREEGNIVTLAENDSVTLNVKPNEGYEIEAITVCDKVIEITNKDGMDITVGYEDINGVNCIVDAKFVAKSVVEVEEAKGETAIIQDLVIPDENKPEVPENPDTPETPEEPDTLEDIDITPYMFDSNYYADMNADIKEAYGRNKEALKNHYLTYGIKEGRQATPIFNVRYYLENNEDVRKEFNNDYEKAYLHFIQYGIKEGRQGSRYFNVRYYLASNEDVKNAYKNNNTYAVMHFVTYGMNEKRTATKDFDLKSYYNNCSDYVKKKLGTNPMKYYAHAQFGNEIIEKPIDITKYMFDSELYYNLYGDLQETIGNDAAELQEHYMTYGLKEGRIASYVFDPAYYISHNEDIERAFGEKGYEEAYYHFIKYGVDEGRKASKYLDVTYYLKENGDLSDEYETNYSKALAHFINYGIEEGRTASEEFNVKAYQKNYDDLSEKFGENWKKYFEHYLAYGQKEDRKCV